MREVVFLLIGGLLIGAVAAAWLSPASVPGFLQSEEPGLALSYDEAYAEWEWLLEHGQADKALEVTDEFLLGPGAGSVDAQSVWAMRAQTQLKGASFEGYPVDRGQLWRLSRVASRRPLHEWFLAGAGLVFLILGAVVPFLRPQAKLTQGPPPVRGPRSGMF